MFDRSNFAFVGKKVTSSPTSISTGRERFKQPTSFATFVPQLRFDSIRKYRFTRVRFRRGEKTIASNNAENVFFFPSPRKLRTISLVKSTLDLLSFSLSFYFFLLQKEFTQVELSSRSTRERERKKENFTSSRIGKARWRTRFAKLGNRGVGRGSFLKRIKYTTLREHNLQPNLQVSCLFPRDLNDSRGRKNCFVKTSFASPSRDVSYLQRKLKTSNGRILIPNVAASSLFLASKHEDVYGNVVSLHLT